MAEIKQVSDYTEDSIRSLDWREHIRLRPGMYIGKLGDGIVSGRWYLCIDKGSDGQLY